MPRRFWALLALSAVVVAVMLAVLRPGGPGDHKSSAYANGEFAFAIDALPWNGTAPCNPIDASNTVNVGANHEVAVCTVNEPQKGAGGADDVNAFEFTLTYNPLLNQCKTNPACPGLPAGKCLDDSPDVNAGSTLGTGSPTSPNLGTGWDCSGLGLTEPTCSGGQAKASCFSISGPYTSGGLSPFPLAVVTFTVLAGGTDTIATTGNVWGGVETGEADPPPGSVSADVVKQGATPAPTATPTATSTPCPGGICPTSTSTPTPWGTPTKTATPTATPTPTATVNPNCSLVVSKRDSPDPVPEGGQITYTITVENDGMGECSDLTVVDEIPADTDCVDASVDASSDIDPADFDVDGCDSSGDVVWETSEILDVGDEVILNMVIELTSGAEDGDTITNEVCATSADDIAGDCDVEKTTVSGPEAFGSISGTVTDPQGNPISGAWVSASPYDGSGTWNYTWTAADGSYTITGLATDQYRVWASAYGYIGEYYDGAREWEDATPVAVLDGQDTSNIDFTMDVGGTISGVVTDAQGDPIEGTWVYADPYEWESGDTWGYARTDTDGSYTIEGLATDSYRVEAEADGYIREYYDGARDYDDATPVAVTEGQNTPNIDFSLDMGGTISGVVRDAQGDPIEGAYIDACPYEGGGYCESAYTGTDGTYTITRLASRNYRVQAEAAGYIREYYDGVRDYADATPVGVIEEQDTPGVDFSLDVGGSISGVVRDSQGDPIEDAWIYADPYEWHAGATSGYTYSGPDGSYTITGLATDEYRVWASAGEYLGEYYDGVRDWSDATPVAVTEGQDTPNIDFSLNVGGRVSCSVTDSDDNPIEDARCCATRYPEGWGGSCCYTGSDGACTIENLATDSYVVRAEAEGYLTEYYDGVREYDDATPVDVVEEEEVAVGFSLDLGGTISGVVRDAQGDPIEDAWVWASPAGDIPISPPLPPADGAGAWTGPDGTYTIIGLATGQYIVGAKADAYLAEYYDGVRDYDSGDPVSVVEGENTSGIDFSLDLGGTISGVVRNAAGDPIEGAWVSADPSDLSAASERVYAAAISPPPPPPWEGGNAQTGPDGTYTIVGLATGAYIVEAEAADYLDEYYDGERNYDDATPVAVTEGQDTSNIDFTMDVGGTISGVVTDSQGDPIEDAWVYADPYDWHSGATWGYAYSGPDGSYTITGLATDSYRVEAEADDYINEYYDGVREWDDADPVGVVEGQNTSGIDFSLDLGGTISGVIRDAEGNPLPDAWACADPYDFGGYGECAGARWDGSYTITGLATGDYIVEAEADGYLDEYYDGVRDYDNATPIGVVEEQETSGIDFSLDEEGTISGVVTDDQGDPIEGAWVVASPTIAAGTVYAAAISPPPFPPGGGSGSTDSDGEYTIGGLAAGAYVVSAGGDGYQTQYYDGVASEDDATPVGVAEGQDTPDIDFSLAPSVPGDANGDGKTSMVDAMLIAQCVVGLIDCGSIDQEMADVNCSGGVTMVDAMLVAQYVVGLIDAFPCILPGGWIENPANHHYYKLTTPLGWPQAEAKAVEWGGHLATVNDREEELWLRGQFGTQEHFWLGFNDLASEGDWVWAGGEPVTYTNWADGEPNNYQEEDAAVMNWAPLPQQYGDSWNDLPVAGYSRGIVEAPSPG